MPILLIFIRADCPGLNWPSIGDRLMVGQRPLKPFIGVRLPVPEPESNKRGSDGYTKRTGIKGFFREC